VDTNPGFFHFNAAKRGIKYACNHDMSPLTHTLTTNTTATSICIAPPTGLGSWDKEVQEHYD